MTTNTRIDLKVPYAEKDQAKVHGAQWDLRIRHGTPLLALTSKTLNAGCPEASCSESSEPDPTPAKNAEKGIALTELLGRVKGIIDEGFPKAEWVRAEISELRGKNGHLYLTLCERNDRG